MKKVLCFSFVFLSAIMSGVLLSSCGGGGGDSSEDVEDSLPSPDPLSEEYSNYSGYWESKNILTGLDYYNYLWLGITIEPDGEVYGRAGIYIKGSCAFENDGICFSYLWSSTKSLTVSGMINQIQVGSETYNNVKIKPINKNQIELTTREWQSTIYRQ